MTKKDYIVIAGAVHRSVSVNLFIEKNRVKREAKQDIARLIATDLAASLGHENPLFDKDKFMAACGIDNRVVATDPKDGLTKLVHVVVED